MKKLLCLMLVLGACQSKKEKAPAVPKHHSEEMVKVLEAHGGFDKWSAMKSLHYVLGEGETQLISLSDRKVLVKNEKRTIGFDGKDVWVLPDSVDAGGARFYHNLYFYFFAMPFVLGDPGITYEFQGSKVLLGKELNGVKVSFGSVVGDSPNDNYILWYDPATYKMEWLMYTSTYRSGKPSDRYNLIKYNDWQAFGGLLLPTKLQWYVYQEDRIGDVRGEALFSDIEISAELPDAMQFEVPSGAQIAEGPEM